MTKFYVTLAAAAALLAMPAMSASASAQSLTASDTNLATLEAPSLSSTLRKIDLQAEPIQQSQEIITQDNQPADQPDAQPDSSAPHNADTTVEVPATDSATTAGAAEPRTAKRLCKKFSAAIAMVIDVPCE